MFTVGSDSFIHLTFRLWDGKPDIRPGSIPAQAGDHSVFRHPSSLRLPHRITVVSYFTNVTRPDPVALLSHAPKGDACLERTHMLPVNPASLKIVTDAHYRQKSLLPA